MKRIETLKDAIQSRRQQLLQHEIYQNIGSRQQLCRFMEAHVFAVWDFMSLLKALQQHFCPATVPWTSPANPEAARLVNEIVLGEETDTDLDGSAASHFQLYRQSMQQCGADLTAVDAFISRLQQAAVVDEALASSDIPEHAARFVRQTFATIRSGNIAAIAAAFTFGREDLLPDVFQKIVDRLNRDSGGQFDQFLYYLDRHIELDGDHHGPMAERLICSLCGESDELWQQATEAAVLALEARLELWDGVLQEILAGKGSVGIP